MDIKQNFDTLQEVFIGVNKAEDLLRVLRNNCDTDTQRAINAALADFALVRNSLWSVDSRLAKGKGI